METKERDKDEWRARLAHRLRRWADEVEQTVGAARWRLKKPRFRPRTPAQIIAYRAFADAAGCELFGRVLANRKRRGPREDDSWWRNLRSAYRRFDTDEVAGARLRLTFSGRDAAATTDEEGYYRVRIELPGGAPGPLWQEALVELEDGRLSTRQPVLVPQAETSFGVISDIDDTVLESRVTHRPTQAKLTLLYNARTRKPLEGVAELYRALQRGTGKGEPINPIFYVSSSPWNLYDLIDDFFELNGIPHGPILLRDLDLGSRRFVAWRSHGHKLDNMRRLFGHFPRLRWVLIGDSGQHDAMLYATAIKESPGRVIAVYIRDIDPDVNSRYDAFVDRYIAEAAAFGIPMLRVRDSNAIAEHAVGLGLIEAPDLDRVAGEVDRDRQRPTTAEAAPRM